MDTKVIKMDLTKDIFSRVMLVKGFIEAYGKSGNAKHLKEAEKYLDIFIEELELLTKPNQDLAMASMYGEISWYALSEDKLLATTMALYEIKIKAKVWAKRYNENQGGDW